jgi:hypothetical protein
MGGTHGTPASTSTKHIQTIQTVNLNPRRGTGPETNIGSQNKKTNLGVHSLSLSTTRSVGDAREMAVGIDCYVCA